MCMLRISHQHGSILPVTLIASAVVGLLAMSGLLLSTPSSGEATMYLEPAALTAVPEDRLVVTLTVESKLPVNAFTGKIVFNQNVLAVEKIDYNTSIADLWAQEPWFNKGDGSLIFTGGTTKRGGFTGTGSLITITFRAMAPGDAQLSLLEARILQHDGLGTDAPLSAPIDTVFIIVPPALSTITPRDTAINLAVQTKQPSPDLNEDGIITIRDLSIFMMYLATSDIRGDVSHDSRVTMTDASIMLEAISR